MLQGLIEQLCSLFHEQKKRGWSDSPKTGETGRTAVLLAAFTKFTRNKCTTQRMQNSHLQVSFRLEPRGPLMNIPFIQFLEKRPVGKLYHYWNTDGQCNSTIIFFNCFLLFDATFIFDVCQHPLSAKL